jgi:predicted DNA-binding ribbon-helix-helix protein
VSVILPRALFGRLSQIGNRTRLTVEQLVAAAAEHLATSPSFQPLAAVSLMTTYQDTGFERRESLDYEILRR